MRPPHLCSPRVAAGLFGLISLLLASCASDERPHRGAPPKPPAPVAGEASYFNGQVVASIRVGAEMNRPEGGEGGGERGKRDGGGRRGGGGGMSFGGGAGPMRLGGGEGGRGAGGPPGGRGDDRRGEPGESGARLMPANGLPLMIHVRLRNTGSAPVEIAIRSFSSPLGNFVVQPATLTVPAGESAEVSPMTSFVQGDLPDEMPATLVLRLAGQTDKQVIVLRPVSHDGATPPPTDR
jgi:hypothetical protein